LVMYRDGLPACRWLPVQVLTFNFVDATNDVTN